MISVSFENVLLRLAVQLAGGLVLSMIPYTNPRTGSAENTQL